MEWPKDRRKAFLWAAEAFGRPYRKRTERQKELTSSGFCCVIDSLTGSDRIYSWASVFSRRCCMGSLWWWPCGKSYDNERSLFCSLMATLSDKEFEELGK